MDEILSQLGSLIPENFDSDAFLTALIGLTAGSIILGLIGRYAFGKRSVLQCSVSSAIGILFIYCLYIVIHATGVSLGFMLSPLPFISLDGDFFSVFIFAGKDYTVICGELLNMVILAFTVSLIDHWIPTGKKLISWLLLRCLSVILGTVAFTVVMWLVNTYLPAGLLTWAPVILLGLLVLSLLLGALKVVVGAALALLNPLLGALYTFFFASILGKMVSRAVLTTIIISAIVYALNYFNLISIFIGTAALVAYLPLLLLLLVLWYVIGKVL